MISISMIKSKSFFFMVFSALILFSITSCEKEPIDDIDPNVELTERQVTIPGLEPWGCTTVTVAMDASCDDNPVWQQGLRDAASLYNDTETGLHVIVTNVEEDADIIIQCDDNLQPVGVGTFPDLNISPQTVGSTITLNGIYEDCRENDPCFHMMVIVHELGHNFGLGHNGELGFTHIDGTDKNGRDFGSMFNEGMTRFVICEPTPLDNFLGWGHAPCEFSNQDLIALQYLFPRPSDPCECPAAFPPFACGGGPDIEIESECPCAINERCLNNKCVPL